MFCDIPIEIIDAGEGLGEKRFGQRCLPHLSRADQKDHLPVLGQMLLKSRSEVAGEHTY